MKTQKLQFALTSLYDSQIKSKTNEKKSDSGNKNEQKNTNIDI